MIYLFYGSDAQKVRTKAFEWVEKARAKEPNLAYARLAREELTSAALEDAALSGGLFVKRLLILIDDPFPSARKASEKTSDGDEENEEENIKSEFEDHIDALADSDNALVILAPKLSALKAKKLVAKAKMSYKFDKVSSREVERGFNSNLVDALGARSREKLWLELNRAMRAGDEPQKIHGLLHWKARDLMVKGSRAWKPQEARSLSLSLIELLQSSRRGNMDLSLSLEKFALSI